MRKAAGPVRWREDGGDLVAEAGGEEVARRPRPTLPDGGQMALFRKYSARLLRPFRGERLLRGADVSAELTPNGLVALLNSAGECFCSDAREGRDFAFRS